MRKGPIDYRLMPGASLVTPPAEAKFYTWKRTLLDSLNNLLLKAKWQDSKYTVTAQFARLAIADDFWLEYEGMRTNVAGLQRLTRLAWILRIVQNRNETCSREFNMFTLFFFATDSEKEYWLGRRIPRPITEPEDVSDQAEWMCQRLPRASGA